MEGKAAEQEGWRGGREKEEGREERRGERKKKRRGKKERNNIIIMMHPLIKSPILPPSLGTEIELGSEF